MMQVIETSHQEKVDMYMMLDKEQLIEMLIESNRLLGVMSNRVGKSNMYFEDHCKCHISHTNSINGKNICTTCNKPLMF